MTDITGTNGPDTLTGTLGDDNISALGGRDTVNATQGHDSVDGGPNLNDRLVVVMSDASRFSEAPAGARTYTVSSGHIGSSSGGLDTSFVNVERVVLDLGGTGDFGDTVDSTAYGGALEVRLGSGNDLVDGGAGNETIYDRGGINLIDTGAGFDGVFVQVDFAANSTVFVTGAGNQLETVHNGVVTNTIVNAEQVIVGYYVDAPFLVDGLTHTIDATGYTGSAQVIFSDHNGDDVFIGSAGSDFFANGFNVTVGNDIYTGNGGADIYDYTVAVNALNNDVITDFDADDIIDFRFNDGSVPGQLLCNSFIGAAAFSGVAGQYRYAIVGNHTEVEIDTDGDAVADRTLTIANGTFALTETAPGSNILMLANPVSGTGDNDWLPGTPGNDTMSALAGSDGLNGGAGDDVLDGGDGSDTAFYYGGATVSLLDQGVAQDSGSEGWDTLISIENLFGSSSADHFTGDDQANWLDGGIARTAPDSVSAVNNDTLDGQGGDDLLEAGIGSHTLIGGDGTDTARFAEWLLGNEGVTLSLAQQGMAQDTGQGLWTLTGIENLSGHFGNDALTGNDGANVLAGSGGDDILSGGIGNDTLLGDGLIAVDVNYVITTYTDATTVFSGVAGNDVLEGGLGDDVIDGGGGNDTASYANASGAVQVTLFNNLTGNGTATGADGSDTLSSIENIIGSAYNDSITGSAASNVLAGGDGRDFLQARGGDDSVYGGNGDDFLGGGTGNDLLDGGAGWDRVSFANGSIAPVTVDLRIQGVAQNTGLGLDTLVDIEHASGTAFGDTLTGNGGDNWLWGGSDGSGNDTIDGREGNDLIETGAGDHVVTGGDDVDTFRFNPFNTPNGATISLALQGAAQDTHAGMMTLSGFENLSGSVFGDTLIGNGDNNVLAGNGDGDILIGGAGNDTLYGDGEIRPGVPGANSGPITTFTDVASIGGFDGNDTLEGGLGDDLIDGGGGTDTATFAHAGGAVTVDLAGGFASGADGNDTLLSIENAAGSGFNDTITGSATANILVGGAGNDGLNGAGGDDTLVGGAGNDSLNGGAGVDTIDYSASSAAVSINLSSGKLSGGDAAGDTVSDVENVIGSAFSDKLIGSAASNTLNGGAGNDTVSGGAGADVLFGGGGNDTFAFAALGDFGSLGNTDRIMDFEAGGPTAATRVDVIDLSAIDANSKTANKDDAFTFIGEGQFTSKAGQLRYDAATSTLSGDVNGDGVADFSLAVTLLGGAFDSSDFLL